MSRMKVIFYTITLFRDNNNNKKLNVIHYFQEIDIDKFLHSFMENIKPLIFDYKACQFTRLSIKLFIPTHWL